MKSLSEIFYLDLRSLAVFRIGLGLVILCDLFSLWPDRDAFFGPHGIYPIYLFHHDPAFYLHWSLHALSDHYWFITCLFIINGVLALMVIAGFHTRLSTFLCWLMAISLMHRNPLVMGIGRDYGLTVFLMWGMLLPLGARYSVDCAIGKKQAPLPERVLSWASAGLICSILMIYLISGWCKINPVWTKNYLAINYVFNNANFVKPLGVWLLQFPQFLKGMTLLVVLLERYFILFLFFAVKPAYGRSLLVAVFCLLHLGMFLTMNVDWFALIMITAWSALTPSPWWNKKPGAVQIGQNVWINTAGAFLLCFTFIWHYLTVREFFYHIKRPDIFKMADIAGLDFPWELFSPSPPFYVRHCYLEPVFENPGLVPKDPLAKKNFMQRYQLIDEKGIRWKYIGESETPQLIPYLRSYLVYYWNKTYPQGPRVRSVLIYFHNDKIIIR